jgi:hypothetical protein
MRNRALRAALGAVAGGFKGYAVDRAYQQEQERLLREEQRQIAREEAAAKREADALARELSRDQRAAVEKGWQETGTYSGLSPRDMPGATPRKPFATTMIGDKSYVMPESEQVEAHREALMKGQQLKKQGKIQQEELRESAKTAGIDPRKLEVLMKAPPAVQGVLAARLFPAPERPREGKAEPSDEEKEDIGLQFISAQARNLALMRALQTAYTQDPALAARPGLLAYDIKKNRTVPLLSASGGYKPPTPKKKEDKDEYEALFKEIGAQKQGGAAPAASVAVPPGADPERYRTDAGYKAWVDSQTRR